MEGGSGLYAVVGKSYNVELEETPSFLGIRVSVEKGEESPACCGLYSRINWGSQPRARVVCVLCAWHYIGLKIQELAYVLESSID